MALQEVKRRFNFTPENPMSSYGPEGSYWKNAFPCEEQVAGLLLLVADAPLRIVRREFGLAPESYLASQPHERYANPTVVSYLDEQSRTLHPAETAILGVTPSIAFLTLLRISDGVVGITDFNTSIGERNANADYVTRKLSSLISAEAKSKMEHPQPQAQIPQLIPCDFLAARDRKALCQQAG